jgi:hypothetical protein
VAARSLHSDKRDFECSGNKCADHVADKYRTLLRPPLPSWPPQLQQLPVQLGEHFLVLREQATQAVVSDDARKAARRVMAQQALEQWQQSESQKLLAQPAAAELFSVVSTPSDLPHQPTREEESFCLRLLTDTLHFSFSDSSSSGDGSSSNSSSSSGSSSGDGSSSSSSSSSSRKFQQRYCTECKEVLSVAHALGHVERKVAAAVAPQLVSIIQKLGEGRRWIGQRADDARKDGRRLLAQMEGVSDQEQIRSQQFQLRMVGMVPRAALRNFFGRRLENEDKKKAKQAADEAQLALFRCFKRHYEALSFCVV